MARNYPNSKKNRERLNESFNKIAMILERTNEMKSFAKNPDQHLNQMKEQPPQMNQNFVNTPNNMNINVNSGSDFNTSN